MKKEPKKSRLYFFRLKTASHPLAVNVARYRSLVTALFAALWPFS